MMMRRMVIAGALFLAGCGGVSEQTLEEAQQAVQDRRDRLDEINAEYKKAKPGSDDELRLRQELLEASKQVQSAQEALDRLALKYAEQHPPPAATETTEEPAAK